MSQAPEDSPNELTPAPHVRRLNRVPLLIAGLLLSVLLAAVAYSYYARLAKTGAKPEEGQKPAATAFRRAGGALKPRESASADEQETDWRPVPAATPVEDRDDNTAALPEKLTADLTTFRTLALRDALANDPDTALLALLHTLSLKLLYSYGAHMTCVEIQAHGLLPNTLKDARQTKPAKAIEARVNGWKQALPREARDLWDFLVSLGQEDRRALLPSLSA